MFDVLPGTPIGELLRQPPIDPLEARILVSHALGLTRVQLITRADQPCTEDEALRLASLFRRRIAGEPIAYLVGEREFFGLMLHTTPDVLIPRPETELLVELALQYLPQGGRVLDLGTGSGAIAIAIAHQRPDAQVTASDRSTAALRIAAANAARHHARVAFIESDWYAAIPPGAFELIVSNPPYIVAGDPHLSQGDLRHEPIDALTDHGDGLGALRQIVAGGAPRLAPGGRLLMEHGYDQASAVRALLQAAGFADVQSWQDLAGIERVSGGRRI
ncbi:peptide chain release factor N(5)-glutamine methyltransferase [Noviherbaspirillum aridicola]|uniref:Release factor glutamine methyltransferase n=1 Tax=Noviherbaspirillum aridicola TaxID=2849687 RepID=A0ABQ4Q942_9BURK|nr:peptide chain release factor N(5)-glutamine methyltransferase [Noviherbaspirillum aridicola]GIZ53496.1 release factor glutamine methyltransferase [Noviherbaspirillum aridicola]